MKKLLLTFCILLFSYCFAFGQAWIWGREGIGPLKSNNFGSHVATDRKGNAYVSGMFSNIVTFGTITLKQPSDNTYLVKYNSSGQVQWALIPNAADDPSDAVDTAGNVYITGSNGTGFYLMKYDSSGTLLWSVSNSVGCIGAAIAADNRGYIYVAGFFNNTQIFGHDTLVAQYHTQVFAAKYDLNGNVVWARQSTGDTAGVVYSVDAVHADAAGNVYLSATFNRDMQFGSNFFTDAKGRNGVVYVKYDKNGNLKWAVNPYVPPTEYSAVGNSITSDLANNSYLSGYFSDSIRFGKIKLANGRGQWTMFLAKYDTNGNAIWAMQANDNTETAYLAADDNNDIYLNCWSDGNFNFNGFLLSMPEESNCIMKLDTAGTVICGSMFDVAIGGNEIACDITGRYVYVAGVSYDTVFVGPDTLIRTNGGSSPYVVRWCPCTGSDVAAQCSVEGINELSANKEGITLYPNPNNGEFTIQIANSNQPMANGKVEVYNMLGEKVYSNSFFSLHSQFSINLSSQPAGIYLFRVTNETSKILGEGKFIIE